MEHKQLLVHSSRKQAILISTSRYLIMAPSGTGKSYFIDELAMDGIPSVDTDTPRHLLRRWAFIDGFSSDPDFYPHESHEVAWHCATMLMAPGIELCFTNDWGIIQLYFLRYGFNIIGIDLAESEYNKRVVDKRDPNKARFNRDRFYKDVVSYSDATSAWLPDFVKFEPYATRRTFTYMEYPPTKASSLKTNLDEDHQFGYFIRSRCMLKAYYDDNIYIGLGDEVESITTAFGLGILSIHFNKEIPKPYSFTNIEKFDGVTDPNLHVGLGQLKLKYMDMPMIVGRHDLVIYIGGSPGDHLLESMWLKKKLVVIDPLPFANNDNPNITWINKAWYGEDLDSMIDIGNSTYTVIFDVRAERHDKSDKEWEKQIEIEHDLGLQLARMVHKDIRCLGYSLKLRTLRNKHSIKVPSHGEIYFQPYAWGESTETRFIMRRGLTGDYEIDDEYSEKLINRATYESRVGSWNMLRNSDPNVERFQSGAILSLCISILDIFHFNGDRYNTKNGFYPVSLFSVSNVSNPKWLAYSLCNRGVTCFVPLLNLSTVWTNGYYNANFSDGVFTRRVKNRIFADWAYNPSDFNRRGIRTYTLNDYVISVDFDVPSILGHPWQRVLRRSTIPVPGFDGSHPFMHLWFACVPELIGGSELQTWFNSQTHVVRYMSPVLREVYGHDKDSLHQIRRSVISILYHKYDPVQIVDRRINGYITYNGKKIYIAVAGHLVNLLLVSGWIHVDIKRYMDTIENNILRYMRSNKVSKVWTVSLRNVIMAESSWRNNYSLWHSYWDWYAALGTAIIMGLALKAPLDMGALLYVGMKLEEFKRKYPKFRDMGFQSASYAKGVNKRG